MGPISHCANIADICVPSQIVSNYNVKIFDILHVIKGHQGPFPLKYRSRLSVLSVSL